MSLAAGLGLLSARSSGWGVGWRDFDNDGWKDLFVAQSHVMDNIERLTPGLTYKEAPLLAKNAAGKLTRVAIEGSTAVAGRGAAHGDRSSPHGSSTVVTWLGPRLDGKR